MTKTDQEKGDKLNPDTLNLSVDGKQVNKHPAWLGYALDYGPLIIFMLVNKFGASKTDPVQGPIYGTIAFMISVTIAAIIAKKIKGKLSPIMWLSIILVLGFGSLTIWLRDPTFIQAKPTFIYLFLAILLIGGALIKKPLIKYVLEAGFDGISDKGWLILSRNWGIFFAAMAVMNEFARAYFSFDTWLLIKIWGVMALTIIFTFINILIMTKYGLNLGDDEESDETNA
ncbi:hypothetical protein LPB140_08275 [Sphingorhabdus lutea]|uniref:Inner membrane-spanning protein YciB n=1 Tax=Sphingorhabdus lutea TaxID=1913578 RepID=A0A1L3JCC8_9SPHN|nr:inner membrane-spanning protein YciB [Sphingorhabdus lutea]APG62784.1 hypothetical protein LPB140_08275 [Sphingorhabdus lutea]